MDNNQGVENWKEHTTAFDRVQSVATTVSEPRQASYIADKAHVAENTAREHLERLVNLTVLQKTERTNGSFYSPDPLHIRIQTLRNLIDENDKEGLVELKIKLQSQIKEWRDEFSVDSPEELRTQVANTDTISETKELKKTASNWELTQYRLTIIEDAIDNYETYVKDFKDNMKAV